MNNSDPKLFENLKQNKSSPDIVPVKNQKELNNQKNKVDDERSKNAIDLLRVIRRIIRSVLLYRFIRCALIIAVILLIVYFCFLIVISMFGYVVGYDAGVSYFKIPFTEFKTEIGISVTEARTTLYSIVIFVVGALFGRIK